MDREQMPRKPRRRPPPRRRRDQPAENEGAQRAIEAAARSLLAQRDPVQLRSELHDRELLLEEADRIAQLDPNPASLARYREARAMVDIARRAVALAGEA